jgi:hypothetical protein
MANATIQISLRGGEAAGGLMRFDPGGRLEGAVQVLPDSNIRAKNVVVRLAWHTEGSGDRDAAVVNQVEIAHGDLAINTAITQNFGFALPAEPWSFAGHYINIIWEVQVVVDIPMAPDMHAEQPFILAPRR